MTLKVVDIHVFGRHLKLNCPEDAIEDLNRAAKDLEKRLNEIRDRSKILSSDQIIITTALNICYELIQERSTVHKFEKIYFDRLTILNKKLDSVLNNKDFYSTPKK